MVSTPEQRRRYRKKYPEKLKQQRRRYLDKKIRKKIEENPTYKIKLEKELLHKFTRLTRLLFKDKLPKICEECESEEDLQIHHKVYKYPIKIKDLKILCRKCHVTEHQRIPTTQEAETPSLPMEHQKHDGVT